MFTPTPLRVLNDKDTAYLKVIDDIAREAGATVVIPQTPHGTRRLYLFDEDVVLKAYTHADNALSWQKGNEFVRVLTEEEAKHWFLRNAPKWTAISIFGHLITTGSTGSFSILEDGEWFPVKNVSRRAGGDIAFHGTNGTVVIHHLWDYLTYRYQESS